MNQRQFRVLGATGEIRTASLHGREHLVVPVAMLMEGVIHAVNAPKPEFVPLRSLAQAPTGWNGRPAMIGHPAEDGVQVSANDPVILEESGVGVIFKARLNGKKLWVDAWIDPERAEKVDGGSRLLEKLRANEPIEVSVGALVTLDATEGVYAGQRYAGVWKEIIPDHLAFLPDGIGACSIAMGCGCNRTAAQHVIDDQGIAPVYEDDTALTPEQAVSFAALEAESTALRELAPLAEGDIEHPFEYCMTNVVPAMAKDGKAPEDPKAFCGWWKAKRAAGVAAEPQPSPTINLEIDGRVLAESLIPTLTEEVKKPEPRAACGCHAEPNAACRCNEKKDQPMAKYTDEQKVAVVKALIANPNSGYTAADEPMLLLAPEDRLDAFVVSVESRTQHMAELKAAAAKPMTEEQWMAAAPKPIRAAFERMQQQETERKTELVTALRTAQSAFTEAELTAMEIPFLEKLARAAGVQEKPDYSGRGIPRAASGAGGQMTEDENAILNPPDPWKPHLAKLPGSRVQ